MYYLKRIKFSYQIYQLSLKNIGKDQSESSIPGSCVIKKDDQSIFQKKKYLFSFNSRRTLFPLWRIGSLYVYKTCVHKGIYFMTHYYYYFFSKVRDEPQPDCSSWWKVIQTLSPLFPLLPGGPYQWDRQILFAWAFVDRRRAALQEALTHNAFEIAASGRQTHHSPWI